MLKCFGTVLGGIHSMISHLIIRVIFDVLKRTLCHIEKWYDEKGKAKESSTKYQGMENLTLSVTLEGFSTSLHLNFFLQKGKKEEKYSAYLIRLLL